MPGHNIYRVWPVNISSGGQRGQAACALLQAKATAIEDDGGPRASCPPDVRIIHMPHFPSPFTVSYPEEGLGEDREKVILS